MIFGIDKYFVSIQIQRSTQSTDSWGNPIQTWANHIVVQGLFRQTNGSEPYTNSKDTPTSTHRLYCRLADIKVTDGVLYKNVLYKIVRVNNVMEFDELMQVDCEVYG